MSILFYRRPDFLNKASGPINSTECARYVERAKNSERAIPSGLSFEDVVIKNTALPPCSLNDFMDYLIYVEHSAENLQFYLWYREYERRFEALPESEKALSPPWTPENSEIPKLAPEPEECNMARRLPKRRKSSAVSMLARDPIFAEISDKSSVPLPANHAAVLASVKDNASFVSRATETSHSQSGGTNMKWEPFSVQPFRDEISRLIHHYLLFSSPRELNLSHRDRASMLHALQHTTHPSALAPALNIVESTLKGQAHPNFIRWSICNGNKPRVFFVRTMGITFTTIGCAVVVLLTLSSANRWWRLFAALPWFIGISTLIAACKGLCMIMHHSHSRNLRPWEQDLTMDFEAGRQSDEIGMASRIAKDGDEDDKNTLASRPSLQSFGDKNEWEGEWLIHYKKKSLLRKIFARSVYTQEAALRILQDKIVLGANIWAAIITTILTAVFIALPGDNLY
ncbi:hypothetical protein PVAG01_06849 [Phlyctema vagabunda]|uniref:RGS domain-containing protein n=1 Tax=Phlyctema vagabunda TaxID=108571 RepID=A0ABR4PHH3_9HELO